MTRKRKPNSTKSDKMKGTEWNLTYIFQEEEKG